MINVLFEDAVDLYFARARVLERLNLVVKSLPPDVVPTLGPDATGVGHVFWYTVEGNGYALRDLRALQDWFIRYQLNAVPGVAEVASGGWQRSAVSDRRRPQPASHLPHPTLCRGGGGDAEQPECRRQCC